MPQWLSKMVGALSPWPAEMSEVQHLLDTARRHRARLMLEPVEMPDKGPVVMVSLIEQIRERDFIIDQPSIGGFSRALTRGERVRISFITESGRLHFESSVIGRIKIPSGGSGNGFFFGYRLELPEQVESEERREASRIPVGFDIAPSVEIVTQGSSVTAPIRGVVQDLSLTGLRVRLRKSEGRIKIGERAQVKSRLPEPVGLLEEMAFVSRIEETGRGDEQIVGLRFERPIENLDDLIKRIITRRSLRLR